MEKSFCIGLAAGMLAGAVLAVNSYKVRKMVADGQKQVKEELDKLTERKEKQQEEKKVEE